MSILSGILFHALGASFAALCYTPQKKIIRWSWQTYWLAQASVCWLLLPLISAGLTIPHLVTVLKMAPASAMWKSFALGAAYGIGGTAFGMAIRYVGYSLTYAISIGISCVLGTLIPPMIHGELAGLMHRNGSAWIIAGIGMGIAGIALCGLSGRLKERDIEENKKEASSFSLATGLPLCLLAGVLSAAYGLAIDQGQPIADTAAAYGAGNYQINAVYIFTNSGAFLTTMIYCIYLHVRGKTFGEYTRPGAGAKSSALTINFSLAILTGILWYSQFFFYGIGHMHMGNYKFTSWAIHMIMLVLFSAMAGLIMKEWAKCYPRTLWVLGLALGVLILSVLMLTYGNYIGGS